MRIFIASADKSCRMALQLLLESEPGMVVIGITDRGEGLVTLVDVSQPEVLLLDYELTKQATVALIGALHRLPHHPKIIVISIDPKAEAATLTAGADSFVSKSFPADELLPTLRQLRSSAIAQ